MALLCLRKALVRPKWQPWSSEVETFISGTVGPIAPYPAAAMELVVIYIDN